MNPLLRTIDAYLDAVPRTATVGETIGPFELFVNAGGGWRFYARPALGATVFRDFEITAVVERQAALGQPQSLEWVVGVTPGVGPAAVAAGLAVVERPLLSLPAETQPRGPLPDGVVVRLASAEDDLAMVTAVAELGFGSPGTTVGPIGVEALPAAAGEIDPATIDFLRRRMTLGLTYTMVAFEKGAPVAIGSHQPLRGVSELVSIACLPAHRRRGLGAAITRALAEDARARGVGTVFLSAGDERVAKLYERVGFQRIGSVGAAAPAAEATAGSH